jgi:hypothetical protein
MTERDWLRFPVVSAGADYLVMGLLVRCNILTYLALPNNEGCDLICIHPDPRHTPGKAEDKLPIAPFDHTMNHHHIVLVMAHDEGSRNNGGRLFLS